MKNKPVKLSRFVYIGNPFVGQNLAATVTVKLEGVVADMTVESADELMKVVQEATAMAIARYMNSVSEQ